MEDKLLLTIAALMDSIRAMQRGDGLRAESKLAEADTLILEAADQREKDRLVSLF